MNKLEKMSFPASFDNIEAFKTKGTVLTLKEAALASNTPVEKLTENLAVVVCCYCLFILKLNHYLVQAHCPELENTQLYLPSYCDVYMLREYCFLGDKACYTKATEAKYFYSLMKSPSLYSSSQNKKLCEKLLKYLSKNLSSQSKMITSPKRVERAIISMRTTKEPSSLKQSNPSYTVTQNTLVQDSTTTETNNSTSDQLALLSAYNETQIEQWLVKNFESHSKITRDAQIAYWCLVFLVCLMLLAMWCLRGFHNRNTRKKSVSCLEESDLLTVNELVLKKAQYLPMFNKKDRVVEVFVHDCGTDP
ncbi:uncharacterized protein LOC131957688 [Physella acuta]|uniref:uncharacterized protein LOC131957688 n=1 Tax=Physella acuta TaxID=109671 RepID=UPI0027DC6AC7|nr:uncharacterized protein LOC131957688 [Physella acuta]